MCINNYKNASDDELKMILLEMKSTANNLANRLSSIKKNYQKECITIISEYAILKNHLKDIYHYINLSKNEDFSNSFYSCYFCPTITDCYNHCIAKINSKDSQKLYSSLYDIDYYIDYYLPKTEVHN